MLASIVLTAGCYTGGHGGPDFRTISNHLGELHLQQVAVQNAVQSCQDGFEECVDVSDAKTCKDEFQECLDGEDDGGTEATGGGNESGDTGAPSETEGTDGGEQEAETGDTDTGDAADTDLPEDDQDAPIDVGDFDVCVDGLTECVVAGGETEQCVDAALACIQDTFSKICEGVEQDCLVAGAPADICEGLSDKC